MKLDVQEPICMLQERSKKNIRRILTLNIDGSSNIIYYFRVRKEPFFNYCYKYDTVLLSINSS